MLHIPLVYLEVRIFGNATVSLTRCARSCHGLDLGQSLEDANRPYPVIVGCSIYRSRVATLKNGSGCHISTDSELPQDFGALSLSQSIDLISLHNPQPLWRSSTVSVYIVIHFSHLTHIYLDTECCCSYFNQGCQIRIFSRTCISI